MWQQVFVCFGQEMEPTKEQLRNSASLTLLVFTRRISLAGHLYTVQLFMSYHICSVKYSSLLAIVSHSSMFAWFRFPASQDPGILSDSDVL